MEFRELRTEEFGRVPPEATEGYSLPTENCRVFGAFDGDEIVGIWCLVTALHAEPVWIKREYRRSPTILRRMWGLLSDAARKSGAKAVVSMILDSNSGTLRICEWLKASRVPGALYFVTVGVDYGSRANGREEADKGGLSIRHQQQ